MARLFYSFTVILLIALGAVWLAEHPGDVTIDWLAYEVQMPVAMALGLIVVVTGLTYAVMRILLWALGGPAAIGDFFRGWRERRAHRALTKGLVALAAGDAETARRVIRDAERAKGEAPLLLLLQAQTAEHTGAEADAERSYRAMLEHQETELLGLLGLTRLLRGRHETGDALEYAERAIRLQPSNEQAYNAAFDIYVAGGQWADARHLTEGAMRGRAVSRALGQRRLAAAHLAEGLDKRRAGDNQAAVQYARKALSLVPGFAPAAILAAELSRTLGRRSRASGIIEAAWAYCPHPELGRIYAQLEARESAAERFRRISALAERQKDHLESRILFARYAIAAKQYGDARKTLADMAGGQPTARVAELMAKLEELENRDTKAAEAWLAKATHAPRDALWLCRGCGLQAAHWVPVCPQCGLFDSQYWKAAGDPGLFAEEVEEPDAPHLPYETAAGGPVPANDGPALGPDSGDELIGLPRQPDDPGLEAEPRADTGLRTFP